MLEYPSKVKNQTWISHPLAQRGSTASCRPLWVLEAAHSTPGILLRHGRLPALSRGQSRKGFCSRSRLWYKRHCHVGHTIQLTFWIQSKVLQESVVENDTVWSLWQAPVGEKQCRPSESGARACHPQQKIICPLRDRSWLLSGPW